MTAPMKKITCCVIYLIKVNYSLYNYTSYKSIWTSLLSKNLTGRISLKKIADKSFICFCFLNAATKPVRLLIYNSSEPQQSRIPNKYSS